MSATSKSGLDGETLKGLAASLPDGPLAERVREQHGADLSARVPAPQAPLAQERARTRWKRVASIDGRVVAWIQKRGAPEFQRDSRFDLAADSLPGATKPVFVVELGENSAIELRVQEELFVLQVAIDPAGRVNGVPQLLDGEFQTLSAEAHGDGVWWFRLGSLEALRPAYQLEIELDGKVQVFEFFG